MHRAACTRVPPLARVLSLSFLAGCGDSGSTLLPPPEQPLESGMPLDYGPVLIGASRVLSLELTNPNPTPVRIDDLAFRGNDAEDFVVASDLPTVAPRASGWVDVEFAPRAAERGRRDAEAVVTTGPISTAESLTGFAIDVTFTVAPDTVDFGRFAPGTNRTRPLEITNTTATPASYRGEVPAESPFELSTESITLGGFETGSMTLAFRAPIAPAREVASSALVIRSVGLASDAARVDVRAETARQPLECPSELEVDRPVSSDSARAGTMCTNGTSQALDVALMDIADDVDDAWGVDFAQRFSVGPGEEFPVELTFRTTAAPARRSEASVRLFPRNPEDPELPLEPSTIAVFSDPR